jgi:hypothetical protein
MKNCPYCKVDVGGNLKKCPFCQSRLVGEDEDKYFPTQLRLKFQSFFFKLQLFIVWIIIISALWLDYIFKLPFGQYGGFHWSLLVLMWLFGFEFSIIHVFKKGMDASRVLSIVAVIVMLMVCITAYYFGALKWVLEWVMPIAVMGTIVANFVFSMIDKSGNAMVYLLTDLLIGIVPYFVCMTLKKNCPIEWMICLLVSFIIFVGAIIFRGREVVNEIQRRLSV